MKKGFVCQQDFDNKIRRYRWFLPEETWNVCWDLLFVAFSQHWIPFETKHTHQNRRMLCYGKLCAAGGSVTTGYPTRM